MALGYYIAGTNGIQAYAESGGKNYAWPADTPSTSGEGHPGVADGQVVTFTPGTDLLATDVAIVSGHIEPPIFQNGTRTPTVNPA